MDGLFLAIAIAAGGFLLANSGDKWTKGLEERRSRKSADRMWAAYGGPPPREHIEWMRSQLRGHLGLERPEIREELDRLERELAASQANPKRRGK